MARPKAFLSTASYILRITQMSSAQAKKIKRQSENNLISSGTCYYGPNQPADSAYIPCGNTAFGNFHCCEAQSNCLENNACFDGDQGTTYVAGCTDPSYQDPSCPDRSPYSDQQWSGLVYCNGTSDEWTLCDDSSADSLTVVAVPGCYCPTDESERNVAFEGTSPLDSQIVLPAAAGESMSLFPGFTLGNVPTSTPTPTTTTTTTTSTPPPTTTSSITTTTSKSTTTKPPTAVISTTTSSSVNSSSSSSSRSSTSSSKSSSSPGSSPASPTTPLQSPSTTTFTSPAAASASSTGAIAATSSSLSTGAKAGIGIGAAIGGLALIAALAFLALCVRRRKQRSQLSSHPTYDPNAEVQPLPMSQPPQGQNPNRYSPAWSVAAKSELAGDTSTSSPSIPQSNWSRPLSEAEGSYPTYQSMAGSSELGGTYQPSRQYQAAGTASSTSQGSYRPGRRVEGGERGVYEMPAQLPGSTMM